MEEGSKREEEKRVKRDSIPHHGNERTSQAQKVARQGRHKGAGKRNHIIIIDEVEYHVGAFPYIPDTRTCTTL